ncbi:MAG: site-specific DNA-methyltransferase [Candidatus Cloacimonetes bacterium]|nr:site-specific DNA-methyltransferase [Candidatus Cloacimonadota bacterium]
MRLQEYENAPDFGANNLKYAIENGDSTNVLSSIENDSIQLIITSPPYNVGKSYETKTSIESYLETQESIITELIRVLSPNGSICWEVGNYVNKGEVFPLDIYYYEIFKKHGLQLRNRIIWRFGHGLHATYRFSGRYETILWFTKSDEYVFNLDDVRVPSKYPGKRHFKGPNKGKLSGNPLGKNPSDVWTVLKSDWEQEYWDIPNVKSNHPEKTIHPCQFPVELAERCVLALSNKDDWVLDPFAGVGFTMIAALKNGRNAIGIEKEAEYCEIAKERIKSLENGLLRTRPIGQAIHVPSLKDKIASFPEEWENLSIFGEQG